MRLPFDVFRALFGEKIMAAAVLRGGEHRFDEDDFEMLKSGGNFCDKSIARAWSLTFQSRLIRRALWE